ncbi:uncharacterized protein EAF01_007647 [Botrytis porri]|uniref:Uncharacterized protein n=1 Tax=Botrytis porri TaxID=87229 RepID=A0A4Z1KD76_9HELO|nr:uncharacterized protein EAF01_007647 [Botrytis porri]KAF7900345.1 hypothetical protein EAF01_007647 [Botrytis porri]TGO84091.1 hypothetical protein BPOR_0551g00020 [Botrytis porri]
MLFFNPSRIMSNMIGFLSLLSFLSVTVPIVNASPIVSNAVSLAPRADPGFTCHMAPENYCTIGITVTPSRIAVDLPEFIYLFDSYCNRYGFMESGFNIDMASCLPYKVVGTLAAEERAMERIATNPSICYAGRCWGSNDPCWYRVPISNGEDQWQNVCVFQCNNMNARRDNTIEAIDGALVDIKALDGTIEARVGETIETRDGTIARRGDVCHHADAGYCTIAVTVTPSRLAAGATDDWVYLFDSSCRTIGGMYSGQDIDMASQLPYKIVGHMAFQNQRLTAFPDFCYAGRCTSAYDGCWIHSDIGNNQWVNRCQFRCN